MEKIPDIKKKEFLSLIENVTDIPGVKDCSNSKIYRRQWLTTVNFCLAMTLFGMASGHSTILIDQLKTNGTSHVISGENSKILNNSKITVDDLEVASWIVAILQLCMSPSCWVLVIFDRKFGRKKILWFTIGLFMISWSLIALADNVTHILIGRALSGICGGIIVALSSVYQGEVSIPKLRTTLNSVTAIAFAVGMALSHALAIWFHWRMIALIASLISTITLFSINTMPESPIWLLKRNKFKKAIQSWTYLRGIRDLDELQSMHNTKLKDCPEEEMISEKESVIYKYWRPQFFKPLGIMFIYFTVLQLSGVGAVMNYCAQMIRSIVGRDHVYAATIVLDIFRALAAIVVSIVSKRYNSRILSLWVASGTSLFLITLSISLFYEIWTPWSSLILLYCYQAVVIGLLTLPWALCSELFPTSVKEIGLCLVCSYNYLIMFVVLKINPYLIYNLNPSGTFMFYGLCTITGSLVFYFMLPDTRNKSLKEIELMFSNDG